MGTVLISLTHEKSEDAYYRKNLYLYFTHKQVSRKTESEDYILTLIAAEDESVSFQEV